MSRYVIALEVDSSVVEPCCSPEEFQSELIPFVLSNTVDNSGNFSLYMNGRHRTERIKKLKELTEGLIFGQGREGQKFRTLLQRKYGTKLSWIGNILRIVGELVFGNTCTSKGNNSEILLLLFQTAPTVNRQHQTLDLFRRSSTREYVSKSPISNATALIGPFTSSTLNINSIPSWAATIEEKVKRLFGNVEDYPVLSSGDANNQENVSSSPSVPTTSADLPPLWLALHSVIQKHDKLLIVKTQTEPGPDSFASATRLSLASDFLLKFVDSASVLSLGEFRSETLQLFQDFSDKLGGISLNLTSENLVPTIHAPLQMFYLTADFAEEKRKCFLLKKERLGGSKGRVSITNDTQLQYHSSGGSHTTSGGGHASPDSRTSTTSTPGRTVHSSSNSGGALKSSTSGGALKSSTTGGTLNSFHKKKQQLPHGPLTILNLAEISLEESSKFANVFDNILFQPQYSNNVVNKAHNVLRRNSSGLSIGNSSGNLNDHLHGKDEWYLRSGIGNMNIHSRMLPVVPTAKMLEALLDSSFTPKFRYAKTLRWTRNKRGLRDCLFGDQGYLGLEFEEPCPKNTYNWILENTHPPASMLDLSPGCILESIDVEAVRFYSNYNTASIPENSHSEGNLHFSGGNLQSSEGNLQSMNTGGNMGQSKEVFVQHSVQQHSVQHSVEKFIEETEMGGQSQSGQGVPMTTGVPGVPMTKGICPGTNKVGIVMRISSPTNLRSPPSGSSADEGPSTEDEDYTPPQFSGAMTKADLYKRVNRRPINVVFSSPKDTLNMNATTESILRNQRFAFAEMVVSELRSYFSPLTPTTEPLKSISERFQKFKDQNMGRKIADGKGCAADDCRHNKSKPYCLMTKTIVTLGQDLSQEGPDNLADSESNRGRTTGNPSTSANPSNANAKPTNPQFPTILRDSSGAIPSKEPSKGDTSPDSPKDHAASSGSSEMVGNSNTSMGITNSSTELKNSSPTTSNTTTTCNANKTVIITPCFGNLPHSILQYISTFFLGDIRFLTRNSRVCRRWREAYSLYGLNGGISLGDELGGNVIVSRKESSSTETNESSSSIETKECQQQKAVRKLWSLHLKHTPITVENNKYPIKDRKAFWKYLSGYTHSLSTPKQFTCHTLRSSLLVLSFGEVPTTDVLNDTKSGFDAVVGFQGAADYILNTDQDFWEGIFLTNHKSLDINVRIMRTFQTLLCGYDLTLFRHFFMEGLAPEIFTFAWLQNLLVDSLNNTENLTLTKDLFLRMWEIYLVDRSFKFPMNVLINFYSEQNEILRKFPCDKMLEKLWNQDTVLDIALWKNAVLKCKVTRKMMEQAGK